MTNSAIDWQTRFDWHALGDLQIAIAVTGGGTSIVRECFARSGASTNFVHAVVPYAHRSLADLIGGAPESSVSASVAKLMARAALRLAEQWTQRPGLPCLGIGLTACLPTKTAGHHAPAQIFLAAKNEADEFDLHRLIHGIDRESAEQQTVAAFFELLQRIV